MKISDEAARACAAAAWPNVWEHLSEKGKAESTEAARRGLEAALATQSPAQPEALSVALAPAAPVTGWPEYKPCIIENQAGGVAELVLRDVASVYGEERVCRVIRDMFTGEEIGFQWDIPAPNEPLQRDGV